MRANASPLWAAMPCQNSVEVGLPNSGLLLVKLNLTEPIEYQ